MQYWLKFEFLELEALLEAIQTRNAIEKKLASVVEKYRDACNEALTLEQGGMTFKTFFLNRESKQTVLQEIKDKLPAMEVEISNLRLHSSIVTLQQAREVIPFFQRSKFVEFYKRVNQFSGKEVKSADRALGLFQNILGLNTGLIKENVSFWRDREADESSNVISFVDR